ncbi:MAG: efflux RND transporter periplasmic adaptor subunit [Thermoanaerobaculia bacterium]
MRRASALLILLCLLAACRGNAGESSPASPLSSTLATPVRVAPVMRATLTETVTGPGRTAALTQLKVRAPFAGTLTELLALDGDTVRPGQILGMIVSRDSEAALSGAREMRSEARSPAEEKDADRAIALAEKTLVRAPLSASAGGRVLSHSAGRGDRVSEGQEILTIEDASSVVFLADLPQGDLPRVRPGQPATLEVGGYAKPILAVVHGLLPSANPTDFTAPVRIDFGPLPTPLPLGLFGTARIAVARHESALVVPDAAVIRDDVTGVTRVARVSQGRAHWLVVTPGARDRGLTEVSGDGLTDGDTVIVSGQVGLPEGATVTPQP